MARYILSGLFVYIYCKSTYRRRPPHTETQQHCLFEELANLYLKFVLGGLLLLLQLLMQMLTLMLLLVN